MQLNVKQNNIERLACLKALFSTSLEHKLYEFLFDVAIAFVEWVLLVDGCVIIDALKSQGATLLGGLCRASTTICVYWMSLNEISVPFFSIKFHWWIVYCCRWNVDILVNVCWRCITVILYLITWVLWIVHWRPSIGSPFR